MRYVTPYSGYFPSPSLFLSLPFRIGGGRSAEGSKSVTAPAEAVGPGFNPTRIFMRSLRLLYFSTMSYVALHCSHRSQEDCLLTTIAVPTSHLSARSRRPLLEAPAATASQCTQLPKNSNKPSPVSRAGPQPQLTTTHSLWANITAFMFFASMTR
jgi:hypothetical protein